MCVQQDWKDAKKSADECMAEFDQNTGVVPIATNNCEQLLYKVMKSRERT